jgi:hypothetical protein
MTDKQSKEEWLALRRAEAKLLGPATAKIEWSFGQILDTYDLDQDLLDECYCVGRVYFARRPGGDIWVCFRDLPVGIRKAQWKRVDGDGPNLLRRTAPALFYIDVVDTVSWPPNASKEGSSDEG